MYLVHISVLPAHMNSMKYCHLLIWHLDCIESNGSSSHCRVILGSFRVILEQCVQSLCNDCVFVTVSLNDHVFKATDSRESLEIHLVSVVAVTSRHDSPPLHLVVQEITSSHYPFITKLRAGHTLRLLGQCIRNDLTKLD